MKRLGIIAALAGELKPLVQGWTTVPLVNGCRYTKLANGVEMVAVYCGMGREAAAVASMEAMKDAPLDGIVSIGWAGALSAVMRPGHSYRVTDVVDASTGERYQTESHGDETVRVVTSRRVILKQEKQQLADDFGAGLVDMEAATVARLARAREVPFYCYKAVSDSVEDALPNMNAYITASGQMRTGAFAAGVLLKPRSWPALVRMRTNSRLGAVALAGDVMNLQREISDEHGNQRHE